MKVNIKNYRNAATFSINELEDFIAEFNKDGEKNQTAWAFIRWLDNKQHKACLWNTKSQGYKKLK